MFNKKKYIFAIYKEQSFSKAAQKLFISQPALSLIVSKVEKEVGTPIFDRSTNPISLTQFGEKYIQDIKKINQIEKELQNYISDINNSNIGTFTVGCNNLYLSYVLPKFIMLFAKQYPGINLNLIEGSTESLQQKLRDNELDLVLDNKEIDSPAFDKKYFGIEHLILAAPTAYSNQVQLEKYKLSSKDILKDRHLSSKVAPVPLDLFKKSPFIVMTPGNDTKERTDQIFKSSGFTPNILFEFNQLSTVFNVAASGAACSIVSDTLVKNLNTKIKNVDFFRLDEEHSTRKVYFQFSKNKYLPKALERFMEICIENK